MNIQMTGNLGMLLLALGVLGITSNSLNAQALYSSQESLNRVWSNPAETAFTTEGGLRINSRLQRISSVSGVPYQTYWVTNENRINDWFSTGVSFYYDLDGAALNRFQFGVPLAARFGEEVQWSVGVTPYAHLSYFGSSSGNPVETPGGFPAQNEWIWNAGAHLGGALKWNGLHVGMAFFNGVHTTNDFTEYEVPRVYGSYRFTLQEGLELEPVATLRFNEQADVTDIGGHLWLQKAILIGAHYRNASNDYGNWLVLQLGYSVINQFEFYTSFDFDIGNTQIPGFTAEIGLQYSFND